MGNIDGDRHADTNGHGVSINNSPVATDGQRHFGTQSGTGRGSCIFNAQADCLGFIDDSETWRAFQNHPDIPFFIIAGDEAMDGSGKSGGLCICRDIMDLAIGDEECASETFRGHITQCLRQG